jgi:Zn-dependent protease with chaperone function
MPGPTARKRLDERVLVAGTTVRFAQLLVLISATSAGMAVALLSGIDNTGGLGCFLAAGGDPLNLETAAINSLVQRIDAFDRCAERFDPQPPWWYAAAWLAATAATAVALFHLHPAWLVRRRGLEPLDPKRHAEAIEVLTDLATQVGLPRLPRIAVDPDPLAENPFVFGRNGDPVVLVPQSMLPPWQETTQEPERRAAIFRAVMLHEFAHIRNRDVTVTYATVTLWWAFAATTLLPFLVWRVSVLVDTVRLPTGRPHVVLAVRDIAFAVVLALVIYLVRVEVLRNRELYADLTADRLGADLSMLERWKDRRSGGRLARLGVAIRRLLDHHPTPAERWKVLGDTETLFAARPLPVLLSGVAVVLIGDQLEWALPWVVPEPLVPQLVALTQAGLVAGVVGIALWRAVVYAAATSARPPSGIGAGLWLGAGFVLGELIQGRINGFQWTSLHPEVLAFALAAGVVFCWWTARCVALWLSVWRSRSILPTALLVLVAGALALSAWFAWWQDTGVVYAYSGLRMDSAVVLEVLQADIDPGAGTPMMVELFAVVLEPTYSLGRRPLVWAALMIVWIVPLLAWLPRRRRNDPLWIDRKSDAAVTQPPPPLRRVLTAALIGSASCWITIAAVSAYLRAAHDTADVGLTAIAHLMWTMLALVLSGAAAAAAAGMLVNRYRLPAALIAASLAWLGGAAGVFGLLKLDGCVDALSVFGGGCAQMPAATAWSHLELAVPYALVAAVAAAFAAVALTAVLARIGRRRPAVAPRPHPLVRRLVAAALCVVAAGIAVTGEVAEARRDVAADAAAAMPELLRTEAVPPSPLVQRMQIEAWSQYGGNDLLDRLTAVFDDMTAALEGEGFDRHGFRAHCEEAAGVAADARRYFDMPDVEAQAYWDLALDQIEAVGPICVTAIDTFNDALFARALTEIAAVTDSMAAVVARIQVLLTAGSE